MSDDVWPETTEQAWIGANLRIKTKRGTDEPLRANRLQSRLCGAIAEQEARGLPVRIIVLKGRQFGTSTMGEAILFARCHNLPNRTALVCAHDDDSSQQLFLMARRFQDGLREPRPTDASSRREILWAAPHNSQIIVQTAGKTRLGRAYTLHYLHASEVAWWTHDEQTWTSVMQAVADEPGTIVIAESTANGVGGVFWEVWWDAVTRMEADPNNYNGFVPVFLSWLDHPEYQMRGPND